MELRIAFYAPFKHPGHPHPSGDLFVFPGIQESLGMVYLKVQSCGLPVVAFSNGGVPEVVADGSSGGLSPSRRPGPEERDGEGGGVCSEAA